MASHRLLPGHLALAASLVAATPDTPAAPRAGMPGVEIVPFAVTSGIINPIGIAVGPDDRVAVIESHARTPGTPRSGPAPDRIVVLHDPDGDGQAVSHRELASGFQDALSLVYTPSGELIVVCAGGVWRLRDPDGDGTAEHRERLATFATANTHPHSALLGAAVGPDGFVYVSRGHNESFGWRLTARDGATLAGYGDGGGVVRMRADGTGLQPVTTGFRNPFAIGFDAAGRLFVADNDPDGVGPNRLVHGVDGGDYGYRSLHGSAGTHPFVGWDGDRPGSLPYAVALGEAPAGILPLPPGADGDLLVALWGDHQIVRIRLHRSGASVRGTTETVIAGADDFRPVALAADSRGTVYITDWVREIYPDRDGGRIWAVRGLPDGGTSAGRRPGSGWETADARQRRRLATAGPFSAGNLRRALRSGDPFRTQAARRGLAQPARRRTLERFRTNRDPAVRLGALLAGASSGTSNPPAGLTAALSDPDPEVRRAALILAGESLDPGLSPELDRALVAGPVDARLFTTYLAAVEMLQPGFVSAYQSRGEPRASALPRPPVAGVLERFVDDPGQPGFVRAIALRRWMAERPSDHRARLIGLLRDPGTPVAAEAARALARASHPEIDAALRGMAVDPNASLAVRLECLLSLGTRHDPGVSELLPLLADPEPEIRHESARLLRAHLDHAEHPGVRAAFERIAGSPMGAENDILLDALGRTPRPESREAWAEAAATGGDPERGRRVFFSAQTGCSQCHSIGDSGGGAGPDLTRIGTSLDRHRLVRALLDPSADIAPEYQTWYVETADGPTFQGLHLDRDADGSLELTLPGIGRHRIAADDVADSGPLPMSLMPDGLEQGMTVGEFRDLAAYLESLR